jgi:hypothetical protein
MAASIVGPIQGISPGLPGGVRAALNVSAPVVIKNGAGICCTISCVTAGSITLNDNNSLGGTNTAANEFYSGSLTAGQLLKLNWPVGTGITVSAVTSFVGSIAFS